MRVSVLIPTKNEPYVGRLISEIHKVMRKINHEIIVIDKSDIPPKAQGALLLKQKSDGLGNAVLEGVARSKGDVIVTIDGDGSHRPVDILKLLDALKSADIVIGSKFTGGGTTKDQYHRKIISDTFRAFERIILHIGVRDSMSGFSAIKKEIYDKIELNPLGYKINMEIMFKAKKLGYKIKEVPIVFLPRKAGKSKSTISEGIRTIIFVLKLRLGH